MGLLAKLKEKAEEHTVSGVLALIVLLFLIVWRAVPSAVWDKVSEVTPKRGLWALLGLLLIAAILEGTYIVELRRKNKNKLKPRFGVYWDRELTPHCPACSKVLAYIYEQEGFFGTWGFKCAQCPTFIPLNDDDGQSIEIADAKRLLSGGQIETPELDETSMRIIQLVALPNSKLTADDLARTIHIDPIRMDHYLSNLCKQKFIFGSFSFAVPSGPTTYHLNDKGRELLVSKNLV